MKRKLTGRKKIEGIVEQVIPSDEKETYAMALAQVTDAEGWSVIKFDVPTEPDSRFWKFLMDKTPDSWFECRTVYQVLTKQPENFEKGEQIKIEVVPSYLSTGKTFKGNAPGTAVVYAEDFEGDSL
jgi:hypothetical protein